MRAQLYLDNRIRKMLKEPFETFAKTYHERVIPIFSSLEEESQAIADEKYEDLGRYFNPENDDPADYAEMAWEAGLEHYESMSLMQYNMRLMWISTLYQFWEQQVRKFVFEEVTRTHKFIDKKGNDVDFAGFCTRGIDDIKEECNEFGQDLEKLISWSKIEELRLLANVIKHGEDWSKRRKLENFLKRLDFLNGPKIKKLMKYCQTPRASHEMLAFMGDVMTIEHFRTTIINPLVEMDRLKRTIPEYIYSHDQKYYTES